MSSKKKLSVTFCGVVVSGDGFGAKLGYPTANITRDDFLKREIDLQEGIYGGTVTIVQTGETFPAAIVLGPDAHHPAPKLEAHLLRVSQDLYGMELCFTITTYLRPYKKFDTVRELKAAIAEDIAQIEQLFT